MLAWLALATAPATARETSDWVRCDGLAKPEPITTSLGRLVLVSSTFGLFGMPERDSPELRAKAAAGVAACTAVLDGGVLTDDYWVRRINLLRARAIHHLEAGDTDAMLADLAAIDAVAGPRASDIFYARSFGTASALLSGIGHAARSDGAAASAAALRATTLRPWSTSVQRLAAETLGFDKAVTPAELALADRLVQLDPGYRTRRAELRANAADWAGALADWDMVTPPADAPPPGALATGPLALGNGDLIVRLGNMAYAAAMTGDTARSTALLARMQGLVPPALDAPAAAPDPSSDRGAANWAAVRQSFERMARPRLVLAADTATAMVTARLALLAGKPGDAAAALAAAPSLQTAPATLALIDAISAALPPAQRIGGDAVTLAGRRGEVATALSKPPRLKFDALFEILPQAEDAARLNGYSSQWGWGLKSTGFKQRTPKLPATHTTIEFVGDISSRGAVEEMTLLRAADAALAAGKPGLLIVARRDYQRYSQMTMNGRPIGERAPAGFKSEIDVEFVDPAALPPALAGQHDRIIAAAAIRDALAPLYVKDAPARSAASARAAS